MVDALLHTLTEASAVSGPLPLSPHVYNVSLNLLPNHHDPKDDKEKGKKTPKKGKGPKGKGKKGKHRWEDDVVLPGDMQVGALSLWVCVTYY